MMREILEGLKNLANINKSVEELEKKMDRMIDGMENIRNNIGHVDRRVVRLEEARNSIQADVKSSLMEELTHMMIGMNDKINNLEDKYNDLKKEVERVSRSRKKKRRNPLGL
ncbi:MAG TPA: hypothetical protein VNM22_03170 [Candidatus Limnocylindrales bacterium]|jgi:chromosome segregation ATPase|nr:hypothetical protein [Candidatus Limnocylindrales bacterium]